MNQAFISIKKDGEWVPLVGEKFGDYTFNFNDKVRAADEWWYTGDEYIGIYYDENKEWYVEAVYTLATHEVALNVHDDRGLEVDHYTWEPKPVQKYTEDGKDKPLEELTDVVICPIDEQRSKIMTTRVCIPEETFIVSEHSYALLLSAVDSEGKTIGTTIKAYVYLDLSWLRWLAEWLKDLIEWFKYWREYSLDNRLEVTYDVTFNSNWHNFEVDRCMSYYNINMTGYANGRHVYFDGNTTKGSECSEHKGFYTWSGNGGSATLQVKRYGYIADYSYIPGISVSLHSTLDANFIGYYLPGYIWYTGNTSSINITATVYHVNTWTDKKTYVGTYQHTIVPSDSDKVTYITPGHYEEKVFAPIDVAVSSENGVANRTGRGSFGYYYQLPDSVYDDIHIAIKDK